MSHSRCPRGACDAARPSSWHPEVMGAAPVGSSDDGRRDVRVTRKRAAVGLCVLLAVVAAVSWFGFGYPGDLPCQWHEAREGSRYLNRPTRLTDVREWASEQGLDLAVVGTEEIERPGAELELPSGDAMLHTSKPEVGDVTEASACRPAGFRERADVYVRVAVREANANS